MERQQGKLITFCGLDGAGKTSMINLCRDYFTEKGVDVVLTRQPTTEFRQRKDFRTFVDCGDFSPYDFKALSLAAMADRLQHVNKFIVPLINEGKTVICDRYFFSCIVNHRAMGYVDDAWLYAI